jgi:hypothetical protein
MAERYIVNSIRAFLEFDDKDPEASNEYLIDFTPLIGEGLALSGEPVVEIEAAGNAESPVELTVADKSLAPVPDAGESPPPDVAVRFFLTGGTAACRYRGKIKCNVVSDTSPSPGRVLVKRFYVVCTTT